VPRGRTDRGTRADRSGRSGFPPRELLSDHAEEHRALTQRELVFRTATVIALVALAWMVFWFVVHVTEILILLLVSAILASGFAPAVSFLERCRLPGGIRLARGVAIVVVYLVMFAAIGAIGSMIVVPAVNEAGAFVQSLPGLLEQVQRWVAGVQQQFPWLPSTSTVLSRLPQQLTDLSGYGTAAAGVAFRFVGGVAASITVLVFAFYMLLEGAAIRRSFLALFSPHERVRVGLLLDHIGAKFGGWLRAQLLLSFTVAVPVALYLAIIGIPFPALLGVIAGLGELIPLVGLWLGAAVAVLVALSQPAWRLIAVVVFYVVIMNIEPHILVPRIMSRVVGMSPILTLVALLSGIKLLGIIGGLLAVPIAAALQVIVSEIVSEIQGPGDDLVVPDGQPSGPPPKGPR
jgi:predicted PurR-regulated permease PerM